MSHSNKSWAKPSPIRPDPLLGMAPTPRLPWLPGPRRASGAQARRGAAAGPDPWAQMVVLLSHHQGAGPRGCRRGWVSQCVSTSFLSSPVVLVGLVTGQAGGDTGGHL